MAEFICPHCGGYKNCIVKVWPYGLNVRRRHRCLECRRRYSTEESLLLPRKPIKGLPVAFQKAASTFSL